MRAPKRLALALSLTLAAGIANEGASSAAPFAATVDPHAQIRTLAGNGIAGNVDGPRDKAEFMFPVDVAIDKRSGAIYVADTGGQRIRKIAPDGTVSTLAGSGEPLASGLEVPGGYQDGPAATARFNRPSGVAVGPDGAVYVADSFNHCIRKIAGGFVSTFAGDPKNPGGSDGPLKDATFLEPRAIAAGSDGSLYVADFTVGVRAISPAGVVSSLGFTGSDLYGLSLWEGPAFSVLYAATKFSIASFNFATGGGGGVYSTPQRLSGLAPTGVVGLGPDMAAVSSATWQGVFFTKFSGSWSPYAGFSRLMVGPDEKDWQQKGGFADGPPSDAQVYDPMGMALDGHGDVVLADAGNRRIRLLPAVDTRWAYSGDDPIPPKPPGTYRIAIVGDVANFFNAMADDSIAANLQRQLDADRAKNGLGARAVEVETVSLGSGDLTAESQYLIAHVPTGSFDAIVWSLGTNAFDHYPRGAHSFFEDEQFVEGILKHVQTKLQGDGTALVLAMHPVAFQTALDDGTYSTYLGPGGGIEGGLQNFIETEKYLDGLGIPAIAVSPRIVEVERSPHAPLFGTDDGRFSPAGNELYAHILADGLTALHPWSASPAATATH